MSGAISLLTCQCQEWVRAFLFAVAIALLGLQTAMNIHPILFSIRVVYLFTWSAAVSCPGVIVYVVPVCVCVDIYHCTAVDLEHAWNASRY